MSLFEPLLYPDSKETKADGYSEKGQANWQVRAEEHSDDIWAMPKDQESTDGEHPSNTEQETKIEARP